MTQKVQKALKDFNILDMFEGPEEMETFINEQHDFHMAVKDHPMNSRIAIVEKD